MTNIAVVRRSTGRWGAVLALLLLAQTAIGLYGIAQPVVWGHQGYHVAEHGLAARNLLRHGEWTPSHHHGPASPDPTRTTYHHPPLLHPYVAVAQAAVGEAPWGVRGVQLLFSLLALGGVWALTRRVRDEATAALACAAFVVTPLNVMFSHLPDHQLIGLAYTLWSFVGLVDWLRTGRRASGALWLGAALLSGLTDWPWYPIAFVTFVSLGWKASRGGEADWLPTMDKRRVWKGLALFALVVVVPFIGHFTVAATSDRWGDLVEAFKSRSMGNDAVYFFLNAAWRMYALHTLPLTIVCFLWVWRTLRTRRSDVGSLLIGAVFAGQSIWLASMPIEFLVHEYRTYWYVLPAAFAAGDLGMVWMRSIRTRSSHGFVRRHAPAIVLTVLLGWSVWHVRYNLETSRRMAGSIFHPHYRPAHELMMAARAAHAMTGPDDTILIGGGLEPRHEVYYLLDRTARKIWSPDQVLAAEKAGESVVVMDSIEGLHQHAAWRDVLSRARTLRIGSVVILDLRGVLPPAIDAGSVFVQDDYGFVLRYLHAPMPGRRVLVDGPAESAVWLARRLGAPGSLMESARRDGEILQSLPEALRATSSRAARSPVAPSR